MILEIRTKISETDLYDSLTFIRLSIRLPHRFNIMRAVRNSNIVRIKLIFYVYFLNKMEQSQLHLDT